MDPNEALRILREALDGDPDENFYSYDFAVEAFASLDTWISGGGFLPKDWQK
ncbi:hypothetical protein MycrhDRAFT_5732 [Mycolicibacterium rhodesiae JS60]|nr:hypothetical protein MycrhDRAFT_5732 [Mycolicibacterium rhodesiae JS60]